MSVDLQDGAGQTTYKKVLYLAWENTASSLGVNWATIVTALLVVGSWEILWLWRGIDSASDAMVNGLVSFAILIIAGCLFFLFHLWNAPLRILEAVEQERYTLREHLDALQSPCVSVAYRDGDTRYRITEPDGAQVAFISLHNETAKAIQNLEVYCLDALPTQPGTAKLNLSTANPSAYSTLSPGDLAWVKSIVYKDHPVVKQLWVPLMYKAPRSEVLQGDEFLVKLVIVGKDIFPERIRLRFGIRNNEFYVSRE